MENSILFQDAHNCLLEFDKATSLFAVYDGHGGHEVAQYCAQSFPEYIKQRETFQKGDYIQALKESFLGFDETLATPEVVTVLKRIADSKDDSGCTAVVALLKDQELYVANAGDSRCVVCRKGEAIEMSLDHKPEDDVEMERIVKAGGKVTGDGRVNGGLNLSRALGDHAYKQSENLPAEEQMITALPDVRTLMINPDEDEFMILACDGIWNSLSSQEVVDFVRPRIQEGHLKLSQICAELFDHCLAPNTLGDGTGCDNMTAVIVQFLPALSSTETKNLKRVALPIENCTEDASVKRSKTEESDLSV
uniref:protein-serine/threonine phosphatase n=1 Tax=Timema bartmani TaxID=61472 RepID=A0A7R9F3S1_9NEOP|nr:unnamed protein product [Timema bartmani]